MYSYIKGIVTILESNYIVLENNGIGYMIFVSNPYSYKLNIEYTVYVYEHIREDENTLYGFKEEEDKKLFLKLINVKGLGPKMALPILFDDNKNEIYNAIENGDINYLKKFPKIGDKVARQIVLDLKGKLTFTDNKTDDYKELTDTLKSLGYKAQDIKKILPSIDFSLTLEKQVKEALKLLLK